MPTYCKVKRTMLAQRLDGWDEDTHPDSSPLHGNVTFTPQLADGDAVTMYDGGMPVTIVPSPIQARISDGQIFHRGVDYIELLAGGDRMNPEVLVWKATFTNLQANGTPVKLRPVIFEAVPDGTVDLTIVAPAPGTAGQGVVKGRDGDHIESLVVEGTNLILRVKDGDGFIRSEQIAIGEVAKTVANDAVTRAETAATSATESASTARSSEETATTKAAAAAASASSAAGSEAVAVAKAGEADASAQAAKVSEDAAKASETAAASSASAAASDSDAAGVSATAAKASEDAAKASESAAGQSEANAASSATTATDARDSAQAYAGGAQTQAQAAQSQADRSKTEADRAATSAQQAADTAASGVPDATTSSKGKVKLAGDLAGTADAPTVPGLATKANASHSHAISDVTNLQSTLDSKAPTSHTHPVAQVTGLQAALDGKADASNRPPVQVVTALPASPVAGTLYLVQES